MQLTIEKRLLTQSEADLLTESMSQFPNIGFIEKNSWNTLFSTIFVATKDHELVGICSAVLLKGWVKIGPFIILEKFQGKGFGKILFTHVVQQFPKKNRYVGSSNPFVWKIAEQNKFRKVKNFWHLSGEIQRYLLIYILKRISVYFYIDALKKLFQRKFPYRYYVLQR